MAFGGVVTFKLEGILPTLKQLKTMDENVQKQVRATLQTQLESWVIDAKAFTPVDTGALQESGRVLKPRGTSLIKFQIVFGGVTRKGKFVDYALEVHENHPTGSNFLGKVVEARSAQLEALLTKDLNTAINKA